jgi:hypothetical protein
MSDQLTADQVHEQVRTLRDRAATPAERIELGKSQIAAIEAAHRDLTGLSDVGPLREFQGLVVVKSRRDDHVKLLATGEQGEDVEVETIEQAAPSGPDAPVVETPAEAAPSEG